MSICNIIEATQILVWLVFNLLLAAKKLYVSMANTQPHTLSHPYVINSTHSIAATPYAKFPPECNNDQTTPIDTLLINNTQSIAWKSYSKFLSGWLFRYLLIAKTTSSGCG